MLSQAAARALRPAAQTSPLLRRSLPPHSALGALPTYAKYSKPAYQSPNSQTTPKKPAAKSPLKSSPSSATAATGAARQTSPGTSLPNDQTWKPKDAIKFGGSAAATSEAAGEATKRSDAEQTAEFNPSASSSANTAPEQQPGPTPKQVHPSEPTPSSAGDPLSADSAFQGPQSSEANTEPESSQPSQPLPDLRQGIPSTFDTEFGGFKKPDTTEPSASRVERDDLDLAATEQPGPSSEGRRRRGENDYDASDYETSVDRQRAKLANYMYASFAFAFLTGSVYYGRPYDEDEEVPAGLQPSELSGWSPGSIYSRIKSRMSGSVEYYTEPTSRKLLPDVPEAQRPPFTLVLSLEDLLIHSEWTREHGWRTAKRPGVDYFLRYLSQYYELVVFTTVPYAMGDPVLRKLDPFRVIMWPLFREATKYEDGKYIKDLSYLNRPLEKTIIIDTKAEHVRNQPDNAIVLPKWQGSAKDPHAQDLVALIPFLEYIGSMGIQDTRKVLESFAGKDIPVEFARRESLAREKFNEQLEKEKSSRPRRSLGGLLNNALGMKAQPGGMTFDNETTVAEGLSQGKMLSDQIRERGQREYMRLEEEIRKNGEKWLKDMEEEEKKLMESSMKDMRKSWFGGSQK